MPLEHSDAPAPEQELRYEIIPSVEITVRFRNIEGDWMTRLETERRNRYRVRDTKTGAVSHGYYMQTDAELFCGELNSKRYHFHHFSWIMPNGRLVRAR